MANRVLLVTFTQALRSLVLSLLPITTLTLIGWSLAGSQTGNTSDPLRASIWFWLGAHLIPFQLKMAPAFVNTFFNNLPIAAAALPFFSLRGGFKRAAAELDNERAARSFLIFWYGILATLAAFLMQSETVKPVIYLAPIYAGALALLSTINLDAQFFSNFKYLGYLILISFGFVITIIAISLGFHFQVAKSLTTIIEPGWIGGILLVLLQLLYLPNIAAAALAYLTGFGFSIGTGTLVSPFIFKLNSIPAIPILAALPTKRNPLFAMAISLFALLLMFNLINSLNSERKIKNGIYKIWQSFWIFIPLSLIFGYQSGGTFISKSLGTFGPAWWSLATILLIGQLTITIAFFLIPQGLLRLVRK